ncbi:MAG: ABC transporter permease [Desulfurococcales archaeon]|nr:ABC transporter permease [Desulfurococcales archaeon]
MARQPVRYRRLREWKRSASWFLSELRRSRTGMFGLVMIIVFVVASVTFPYYGDTEVIANWNTNLQYFKDKLYPKGVPPCWADVFSTKKYTSSQIILPGDINIVREVEVVDASNFTTNPRAKGLNVTAVIYRIEIPFMVDGDVVPKDLILVFDNVTYNQTKGLEIKIGPIKRNIPLVPYISLFYFERPDGAKLYLVGKGGYFKHKINENPLGWPPQSYTSNRTIVALRSGIAGIEGFYNSLLASIYDAYGVNITERSYDAAFRIMDIIFSYDPVETHKLFAGGETEIEDVRALKGSYKMVLEFVIPDNKSVISLERAVLQASCYGLLGTDTNGRDIWQGLLYGLRWALIIGLLTSFLSTMFGALYGVIGGYFGGLVDEIMLRIAQTIYALPLLPFLIILVWTFGKAITVWWIIILLVLFSWPGTSFITRSMALQLKEEPYVEVARALGAGHARIVTLYIFPQVLPYVFASIALSVPGAIVAEASLSFLGLGDVEIVTWGRMLRDAQLAQASLSGMWWWIVPPGLGIALVGLSFVMLGYALDAILNPKLRR